MTQTLELSENTLKHLIIKMLQRAITDLLKQMLKSLSREREDIKKKKTKNQVDVLKLKNAITKN